MLMFKVSFEITIYLKSEEFGQTTSDVSIPDDKVSSKSINEQNTPEMLIEYQEGLYEVNQLVVQTFLKTYYCFFSLVDSRASLSFS